MLIEEKKLSHWVDHFYGYGSWQAQCWFVAYEEGGGDVPEEVADKLNYFKDVHGTKESMLCDVREMYKQVSFKVDGPRSNLFANLFDYRFGKHAVQHGAWKNLIAFVHGYLELPVPNLMEYQQHSLATVSMKREALLRLYPLPAHNHAWYYSWLDLPRLPYLKSRAAYEEHVFDKRIDRLLRNMSDFKPEIVVMYGMKDINQLKKSVQAFFPGTKFSMNKAIHRQIPQHHRADLGDTILLITTQLPQLRHNRVETGFDWEVFGKTVNQVSG